MFNSTLLLFIVFPTWFCPSACLVYLYVSLLPSPRFSLPHLLRFLASFISLLLFLGFLFIDRILISFLFFFWSFSFLSSSFPSPRPSLSPFLYPLHLPSSSPTPYLSTSSSSCSSFSCLPSFLWVSVRRRDIQHLFVVFKTFPHASILYLAAAGCQRDTDGCNRRQRNGSKLS